MAFTKATLARLDSGANINAGSFFMYTTADAEATIEADGYFDALADDGTLPVSTNCFMLCISTNGTPFAKFYRFTVTAGDVAIAKELLFAAQT